jgi:hypothetical protein
MRKILSSTLLALTLASGMISIGVMIPIGNDAQAGSGKPPCHSAVCRGQIANDDETGSCIGC